MFIKGAIQSLSRKHYRGIAGQLNFLCTTFFSAAWVWGTFLTILLNLRQAITSPTMQVSIRMSGSSESTSKMTVLSLQKRWKSNDSVFTFNILLFPYSPPTMSFSATWARVILWLESFVSVDITNLDRRSS